MKQEKELNEQLKQEMSVFAENLKGIEHFHLFHIYVNENIKRHTILHKYTRLCSMSSVSLPGVINEEWEKDKKMGDVRKFTHSKENDFANLGFLHTCGFLASTTISLTIIHLCSFIYTRFSFIVLGVCIEGRAASMATGIFTTSCNEEGEYNIRCN